MDSLRIGGEGSIHVTLTPTMTPWSVDVSDIPEQNSVAQFFDIPSASNRIDDRDGVAALVVGHYDSIIDHAKHEDLPWRSIRCSISKEDSSLETVYAFTVDQRETPLGWVAVRKGDNLLDVELYNDSASQINVIELLAHDASMELDANRYGNGLRRVSHYRQIYLSPFIQCV
jgi:hypothetical protein